LAMFYQAQAEKPFVKKTASGEDINLEGLIKADAMIFQAAHLSRATYLAESIDPSVLDENDPERRDPELDIYDPECPHQPPYSAEFISLFRKKQLERVRRRTAWVKELLGRLKGDEKE